MKTSQILTTMAALVCAGSQGITTLKAETASEQAANATSHQDVSALAPEMISKHLRLCAQLGLKVGRTYEFMIFNNEEVHYWTIRSLGANGWILVKDSRHLETWLNLSQVIAVSPAYLSAPEERPKKPNRSR